ncbi:acetyl xylan esterase [Marinilabilia rubra]|uniref:Acetyl xylan esterase n=1 Tax=Marinilabilia rubra TaxID=2162893 RepID=A0A2U2BBU9_9BACT|nr:acetyl xylan esterase [Marinilabilia rubra]
MFYVLTLLLSVSCNVITKLDKSVCEEKHLFILSGQSNMARLNEKESFEPILKQKLGNESVSVVKYAMGSQSIRRWYRNWKPAQGDLPKADPCLYDSLMLKVYPEVEKENFATVSFIWMQGERDAREKHGGVYEESLLGLYNQLCQDLDRKDVNFIIGRLSDFDMLNEKYIHWTMIRDIQVKVAESNPRFDWINTDDLNDGVNRRGKEIKNDLHMSAEGYIKMGERFAQKSIKLIESTK